MPIYEYRCTDCKHAWDDLVATTDSPIPSCPECDSHRTEKLFSTFASTVAGGPDAIAPRRSGGGHGCGPGSCGCGRFPS